MDHSSSANHTSISWHPGEIQHVTSSPRYPKLNGFIERQVRTAKNTIKNVKELDRVFKWQQMTETPVCNNLPSPAVTLMKTKLTTLSSRTEPAPEPQRGKMAERCEMMTRTYNRHAGEQLSLLHRGQPVWVLDHDTKHGNLPLLST